MRKTLFTAIAVVVLAVAAPSGAWHDEGHVYTALAAARALPEDVPAFLRDAGRDLAHLALDPDLHAEKVRPALRDRERPEHFLDWEYLGEHPLPPTRHEFIKLCERLGADPLKVGYLPYALLEGYDRLVWALAEHRRRPDSAIVRAKCVVYAGLLAHYAADLHMPLHTTIHFDGRVERAGATAARLGIHTKVDALNTKLPYAVLFAQPLPEPQPVADVRSYVLEQFHQSHALVDRVYELEDRMPKLAEMAIEDAEVRDFTIERTRAAASFIATLWLSAWRESATVELPFWLDRATFDGGFDESAVPPQPARP